MAFSPSEYGRIELIAWTPIASTAESTAPREASADSASAPREASSSTAPREASADSASADLRGRAGAMANSTSALMVISQSPSPAATKANVTFIDITVNAPSTCAPSYTGDMASDMASFVSYTICAFVEISNAVISAIPPAAVTAIEATLPFAAALFVMERALRRVGLDFKTFIEDLVRYFQSKFVY